MPKTITSKYPQTMFPRRLVCQPDGIKVARPVIFDLNKPVESKPEPQQEKLGKFVRSTKHSTNAACNRAVQLAEKEWNPDKIYETGGENRGADITRYRYGVDADFAWCSTFFNYVYNPNHIKGQNILGMSDRDVMSTQKVLRRAKDVGCFGDVKSGYTPKVGDAIVWKNDKDAGKGHIGIVTEVRDDGSFVTIQGNNNDKVEKIEYSSIEDAMTRISSSGSSQTLQGFIQMSKYNESHDLAEVRTSENDSLISEDATNCWMT